MQPIRAVKSLVSLFLVALLLQWQVGAAEMPVDCVGKYSSFKGKYFVYVGTFTGPKSKGIYYYQMDLGTGVLTPSGLAGETQSPAFLDFEPGHKFLVAINEISKFEGKPAGAVTSFSVDAATGKLTKINQRSTIGSGPCHVLLDSAGKNALVANYGSGSVTVLPLGKGGSLGENTTFIQHAGKSINPDRQGGPHAHCLTLDPANRFAFACDLGLDEVLIYRFDASHGTLVPNDPPFVAIKPGSGPRHMVFHPKGKQAYVINELNSTITRLAYDSARGMLTEQQTISTLPEGFTGKNFPAEIAVSPSGNFLYGSNRGHDSIAIYVIDPVNGALKNVGYESTRGQVPRNFAIAPTGNYLLVANQDSNNLVVFQIDPATGLLKFTGQNLEVPAPVCIRFMGR